MAFAGRIITFVLPKASTRMREKSMARDKRRLRSQELRTHNHQGDALRLGMNWTEEDPSKPQELMESAWGMGHPGTFHFEPLIAEVSHGVFEAGGIRSRPRIHCRRCRFVSRQPEHIGGGDRLSVGRQPRNT